MQHLRLHSLAIVQMQYSASHHKLSEFQTTIFQLHEEVVRQVAASDKEYMLHRSTVLFHYQWKISLFDGTFQKLKRLRKMTEDASSVTGGQVRVYWQRWWILALFSLFTMEQCAIWNTFGPIAQSAEKVDEEHDG